ncbi:MAG: hypothetical protein GY874_13905 [Desulfobacteraceae bacterium]|nr:hypothetical protein [Desulfobacteraceae bacterium]
MNQNSNSPNTGMDAVQKGEARLDLSKNFITQLNAARKSIRIYPIHHEQVQINIKKAFISLNGILKKQSEFILSTGQHCLMADDHELDDKNIACKEIFNFFDNNEIASISFFSGIEQEELFQFLVSLSDSGGEQSANGLKHENKLEFDHICIRFLDYSCLSTTIECQINRQDISGQVQNIWSKINNAMSTGQIKKDQLDLSFVTDPAMLSEVLNQIEQISDDTGSDGDAEPEDSANCDVPVFQSSMAFFDLLIKEFSPEQRKQFLSTTFDVACDQKNNEAVTKLFNELGQEVALDMLQYAKNDGKEISPSLLALMENIGDLAKSGTQDKETDKSSNGFGKGILQKLLDREAYETYVDQPYDSVLRKGVPASDKQAAAQGRISKIAKHLDDKKITCHTCLALVHLMTASKDQQDYRIWARQLTIIKDELINEKSFDCLHTILQISQKEFLNQSDPDKKKILALVLKSFTESEFISAFIKSLLDQDQEICKRAQNLLKSLGKPAAGEILDSLEDDESSGIRRKKLTLLENFGMNAAKEALVRINDPRSDYVCLMLKIIREMGNEEFCKDLYALLDHWDNNIALAALEALLEFRNHMGIEYIDRMISSPWSYDTSHYFFLAGKYKVREVIPVLREHLSRRWSKGANYQCKIAALKTLGQIGDPCCMPELKKIAGKRFSFFHKHHINLKRTLFETLAGYRFQDVKDLIFIGAKNHDNHIRNSCLKLLKKNTKTATDQAA